jgi:hypothetical protein
MAADMQAVKAACKRALAEIASQVEVRRNPENPLSLPANTHQTPLHTSLKRKRSDDEGEVENAGVSADPASSRDVTVELMPNSPTVAVQSEVGMRRPSAKRMRRVMSTVVHTATAMTLGAVATWGALAFS